MTRGVRNPEDSLGADAGGYAPPGEYVKDHTIFRWKGRWHLLSISGRKGETWQIPGNEERFSHSVSNDLRHWTLVGHTLPARGPAARDADMVWAPYVPEPGNGAEEVNAFLTACRQPSRGRKNYQEGAAREIRLAASPDLRRWRALTLSRRIPGKDPHVLKLPDGFALYCMDGVHRGMTAYHSPNLTDFGEPVAAYSDAPQRLNGRNIYESPTVLYYEPWDQYVLFLNLGYAVSDSPWHFTGFSEYETNAPALPAGTVADEPYHHPQIGFAREVFADPTRPGTYLSTSCYGPANHWKLTLFVVVFRSDGRISLDRA